LLRLIQDHLYKENRVLFPMVARFLSPERDAALLERMRAIDAD
jgi:hemerythrin-like domain-containing protein